MIHFFSKLRKSLFENNKFSKYLLYALGEIILVVIGILLALQINTWNQNRKDRIMEKAYLKSIQEDIKKEIDFIKVNILDRYEKKMEVLEMGRAYFQGKYIVTDTSSFISDIRFGGVYGRIIWGFERTTYSELVNTGGFRIISNDSLRKAISDYYLSQNRTSESTYNRETGYINFTNSRAPYDRFNPENVSDFDKKFFLKDLQTEEFYELTNLEITLGITAKATAESIVSRANELQEMIEKQLNYYQDK